MFRLVVLVEGGTVDFPVRTKLFLDDVFRLDDRSPAEREGDEFHDADDFAAGEAPQAEADALADAGQVAFFIRQADDVERDFKSAEQDVADAAAELVGGLAAGQFLVVAFLVVFLRVEADDAGEVAASPTRSVRACSHPGK